MALVSEVYTRVCQRLMEPFGGSLGLFSEAEWLRVFSDVIVDFCKQTGLSKCVFTQQVKLGVSEYLLPDRQIRVEHVFVGGKYIHRTNVQDLDAKNIRWRSEAGVPRNWYEDGLPIKTIGLYPTPNYNGTDISNGSTPPGQYGAFLPTYRGLSTVGTQQPSQTTWALGDTIPLIPASAVQYLAYGVLRKLFMDNSELKDAQRALFCGARYLEGIAAFRAILREELEDDFDDQTA